MGFSALGFIRLLVLAGGLAGSALTLVTPDAGWSFIQAAASVSMLATAILFVIPAAPRARGSGDAGRPIATGSLSEAATPDDDASESRLLAPGDFLERRQGIGATGWGTTLLIAVHRVEAPPGGDAARITDDVRMNVVTAIRSVIRSGDLIGMLDDGTYAVFLRAAPQDMSQSIGERICGRIEDTIFLDSATRLVALSASIGGVTTTPTSVHRELDTARENLANAVARGPGTVHISVAA